MRRYDRSRQGKIRLLCSKAYKYLKSRHRARAISVARRILRLDEDHYYAHFIIGFFLKDEDRPKAIAHLRRSVQSNPRCVDAVSTLGGILGLSSETVHESVALLRKAHYMDPSDVWLVLLLASRCYAIGEIKEAGRLFLLATEMEPENEEILEHYEAYKRWVAERN